jgi:hypothetical protein
MYVVLEKGKIISTEIDFGNAAEMQLALEMDNTRTIRIMKEEDYLEQVAEMESMTEKRLKC